MSCADFEPEIFRGSKMISRLNLELSTLNLKPVFMRLFIAVVILVLLYLPGSSQSKNYLIKKAALSERIEKGKDTVFIINFWATWCGPCVKELVHFEKLNNSFPEEKLKVSNEISLC